MISYSFLCHIGRKKFICFFTDISFRWNEFEERSSDSRSRHTEYDIHDIFSFSNVLIIIPIIFQNDNVFVNRTFFIIERITIQKFHQYSNDYISSTINECLICVVINFRTMQFTRDLIIIACKMDAINCSIHGIWFFVTAICQICIVAIFK